tara:strand:- start:2059 stop:2319 length:261 start_codon:yes stop_codon:yes gene_type:complete
MDRLDLKVIANIRYYLLAKGIDNVEIGASEFNKGSFTLRFNYWKEIKESVVKSIDDLLPDHLCLSKQLVNDDPECGELWSYLIIRK